MKISDFTAAHPDVSLVAVTKNQSVDAILRLIENGATAVGENRVQEAQRKFSKLPDSIQKHLVGHLQTNKAKDAVQLFDLIQSVDSVRLAQKINDEAAKISKTQRILLQVNTAEDEAKYGFSVVDFHDAYTAISAMENVSIEGLMTIGKLGATPSENREAFTRLKQLFDVYDFSTLSMGMSGDYEEAIASGATMVRIGRALF